MAREDNLKSWKKGQSGNPAGKPKGAQSNKTILKKFLAVKMQQKNPFTGEMEEMTVKELINLKQIANALEGDLATYKELADREEGKVTNNVDISTKGESLNYSKEQRDKRLKELIEKQKNVD